MILPAALLSTFLSRLGRTQDRKKGFRDPLPSLNERSLTCGGAWRICKAATFRANCLQHRLGEVRRMFFMRTSRAILAHDRAVAGAPVCVRCDCARHRASLRVPV